LNNPANDVRHAYSFAWMLVILLVSWMQSAAYVAVGQVCESGGKAPTASMGMQDYQGRISINVPSRTRSQTSRMSALRMAMQPSVQSSVWKYHSG